MCYQVAEVQGFFAQWIAYEHLFGGECMHLRYAAWRHFVGEIVRTLYMIPVSLAAQRCERGEAPVDDGDGFFGEWLGKGWRAWREARDVSAGLRDDCRLRASLLRWLHQHVSGSVLAAGLFGLASEAADAERRRIVDAVFDVGADTTLMDMLAAVGVTSEETLLAFAEMGINRIAAALDEERLASCAERPVSSRTGDRRRQPRCVDRPSPG
jgi:hypothetical protein